MRQKSTLALFLSLLSLASFGLVAFFVSNQQFAAFDQTGISMIQGIISPTLTPLMLFFTFIGKTVSFLALSLIISFVLYFVLKRRLELILFLALIVGSNVLSQVIKYAFQRERPGINPLIEVTGYSFPSGHATNAIALYGFLAFLIWQYVSKRSSRTLIILISAALILTIGFSRIYLGAHYPSDILGGYFTGGFWLASTIWFFQRYQKRHAMDATQKTVTYP